MGKLVLAIALMTMTAHADTSMKGWELYSWTCDKSVCYALLPGTNRLKTAPEIKKAPLDEAKLKARLGQLKRGEDVFATVGDVTTSHQFLTPPPKQVVDEIARLGLKLTVVPVPPNVGTITMKPDRSIVLMLRSLPPGPIAETMQTYKPADKQYKEMLDHVGGLAVGETKMLPPWP